MFQTINTKLLNLMARAQTITRGERGQTTSEYVAVTAVAVAIALTVIFGVLSGALSTAVESIASAITNFVGSNLNNV